MRIRITQIAAERMAPPSTGRLVVWDTVLLGFGMRVSCRGTKTWFVHYRVGGGRGGKRIFETLGTMTQIPDVAEARQAARVSLGKAEAGDNPVVEKKAAVAALITVSVAVDRYLAEGGRTSKKGPWKPKTAKEWRRIFEHDVLPRWRTRPLAEIAKGDVLELVNDKATKRERKRKGLTEGAAVQAGKMLTRLRTFFVWAIANDLVTIDPTIGVRKPATEASRDRVLSDPEVAAFWTGCDKLGKPFAQLLRLMLLTGQRESEVAGMRWSEIDDPKNPQTWTIPAARAKNGKPHIVHLNALAVETIRQVSQIADQDLLFSGTGETPVSGFSNAKERIDAAMLKILRGDPAGSAELAPWVFHDLRRTVTTGLARLAVPPHIADKILNHTAGTIRGVAATYNRFEYLNERKAALDAWGSLVERLTGRNVVKLARVAQAATDA